MPLISMLLTMLLGSQLASAANSSEPVNFVCDAYLAPSGVTYQELVPGLPDLRAWLRMRGDAFHAHARSYSNAVAISANGQYYSSWHRRGEARVDVRETATGHLAHMLRLPPGFAIEEISPDGRRVLAVDMPLNRGPFYTRVLAIDAATGETALDLRAPQGRRGLLFTWVSADVARVHFDDGTRLYRFGKSGPARLIQKDSSSTRFEVPTPDLNGRIRILADAFTPPSRRLGEGWQDFAWWSTEPLGDTPEPAYRRKYAELTRPRYSVDFRVSDSGRWLAMRGSQGIHNRTTGGNFESFVDLYDVSAGRLAKRFFVPRRVVTSLAFSIDETRLAWAGGDVLEVVEIASERKIFSDLRKDRDLTALVTDLAFIDAQHLILYDGHARLRTVRIQP